MSKSNATSSRLWMKRRPDNQKDGKRVVLLLEVAMQKVKLLTNPDLNPSLPNAKKKNTKVTILL